MLDESLRRRIEALNRGPLPAGTLVSSSPADTTPFEAAAPKTRVASSSPKRIEPRAPSHSPRMPGEKALASAAQSLRPIPGLLRRGQVVESAYGQHLAVQIELDELWPGGGRLAAARCEYLQQSFAAAQSAGEPAAVIAADFAALVAALPERALVLDLETCGLAGSALFLVGLLRNVAGVPVIELLFARNYAEEPAVLGTLWQMLPGYDVLVTFNGKAFDWPMICDRSVRHRLAVARNGGSLRHVDILHSARRRWRRQFPDCRLQTLERHVCRRQRTGDIAGHLIPAAYAEYVRTRLEREMDAVLYHNALDLVTLFDLALRMAT